MRCYYGGIKARYPAVKTIATLNWVSMDPTLPLDVWVQSYDNYGTTHDQPDPAFKHGRPGWRHSSGYGCERTVQQL